MKYLITGATGLVGRELIQKLQIQNSKNEIRIVTRNKSTANFNKNIKVFEWDPYNNFIDSEALIGVDTVIHLAGESVAQIRWSKLTKQKIYDSRILVTRFLKNEIEKTDKNIIFIGASAIGIYGDQGDKGLDEDASYGQSYLAKTCIDWEKEIFKKSKENSYAIRIGIVLSSSGGALEQMTPIFKLNLGSTLGKGTQYMSWIHIEDLVEILIFIATKRPKPQVINAVSEQPVTNKEFSKTLAKTLNKKLLFKAPSFIIKAVLGEMSSIVLFSQKVYPKNLKESNFSFKHTNLTQALESIYKDD